MSPLVIRADAGGTLGTGHVMRMIALAQAWQRRGFQSLFITAECPEPLRLRILREGFQHHRIEATRGNKEDWEATIPRADGWIVLDGYHFQSDYQTACQEAGLKVLCVDDFGHCDDWQCDLLLNQNLGSTIPNSKCPTLLGTRYALLREEFLTTYQPVKRWENLQNILVTFGGSDPPNGTAWVLKQLAEVSRQVTVRAIIGPANPHREELLAMDLPYEVDWQIAVTDMPAQFAWADGVISAGGSSCWEWLSFGLPGVVVTIADNQEPVSRELEKEKVALCLGWPDEQDHSETLAKWLERPQEFINRDKAATLVDGRGADRVIAILDQTRCIIRQKHPERDAKFTFDLANDPAVRSAGYSTKPVEWEGHLGWMRRHHDSPDSHLFVIESVDEREMGTLRFHRVGITNQWEVGIGLTETARGKGFADEGIRLGIRELAQLYGITDFLATIRPTNHASKRLFERLAFRHQGTDGDRETWTYRHSLQP